MLRMNWCHCLWNALGLVSFSGAFLNFTLSKLFHTRVRHTEQPTRGEWCNSKSIQGKVNLLTTFAFNESLAHREK